MRLIVDNHPIPFQAGDTVLVAMLRADRHPTGGGCLCLGGDCPHCIATVDGVSYVRTCQVSARAGMVVERHHAAGNPPLPRSDRPGPDVVASHRHCDVVVIGQGASGRAAAADARAEGRHVITLDVADGQEAIGVYAGPMVAARTDGGMLHIYAPQVIVATGAAEIQPVAPGNDLAGLLTARAATALAAAGIEFGRIVSIGTPPANVPTHHVEGRIVRFEGDGHVTAVVVADADGNETRHECDTVALGLGLHPRDALRRQGHDIPGVSAVGDAARPSDIPPCPLAGTVCACSGVTVDDLQHAWDHGFHEMELVKRATLAGTGTCQGSMCLPHLRSFLADRGQVLQPPFTARPVTRQLTIDEISAGATHQPTARTALDAEHRRLGAHMERSGGWWRPWRYDDGWGAYWAVREAVSIMDVSTLGKFIVSGPDALPFLERIYPTQVATIGTGRMRYVLLLDERGYVMDDGVVCKESETRYTLTFTSGGSSHAEMWLRDWAAGWGMDVRILNQTAMLGAINVTGPLARELLLRAGVSDPPGWLCHQRASVAGVPCHIMRLSFTGELSYELHHSAENSVTLWRTLLDLGRDLGIKPHGLETLLTLRLEKGHIIVGQDSDLDSTPRRLNHQWALRLSKPYFIGRDAVLRTDKVPLDKQLAGFEMDGAAPIEGALIYDNGQYAGYVTSSTWSPVLGKSVMLGWLHVSDGHLPTDVTIDNRPARRVAVPFYDREGARARA